MNSAVRTGDQDRKGRGDLYHWRSQSHHSCPCSHIGGCTGGFHGCKCHHRIQTHQDGRWDELTSRKCTKAQEMKTAVTTCDQQKKKHCPTFLTTVSFVRSIEAVGSSIALPASMDALSAATAELQGRAVMSHRGVRFLGTTVLGPLVRAVGAVGITVASPQAWDANGVVALEGCGAAGEGWTGGLVAAVVTVRLIVAHEGGRHTLATAAAELIVCALLWC